MPGVDSSKTIAYIGDDCVTVALLNELADFAWLSCTQVVPTDEVRS